MDTLKFLQTILPEEGFKFVGLGRVGRDGIAHKAYESLELMAQAIESYDAQSNLIVYHACCSYKAASYEAEVNGETKTKYRGSQNWNKTKSFWVDIDCGEDKAAEGKGYLNKTEAAKAIIGFCRTHQFPDPMLVDSGGGLHCYWPLTKAIGPNSWRSIANEFKAALNAAGLLADPTRTADLSSILRPVGSHNRKAGREVREVKVKTQRTFVEPQEFAATVSRAVKALQAHVPKQSSAPGLNDDLITEYDGPTYESSARIMAEHCQQVMFMRDTKGDVDYDTWRGVIGLIKHCTEDIDLAHEWSENRADTGHSNTDVVTRYESWDSGPTLCSFFEKSNDAGCTGCPHRGKIKTPMVLGRVIPEPTEQVVEVVDEEVVVETTVPALPENYEYQNNRMIRFLKDKDGVNQPFTFCYQLFYPIQRIKKADGAFAFTIRMHLPDKRIREFEVDTAAIASSADLLKAMSKYELMPSNNKDATMHLTAYIRDSITKLMTEQREVDTLTSFGWRENMAGFLLGDRLYHTDGSIRRVYVGGAAATYKNTYPVPRGTLEGYAEAVNFIYNRESSEAAQYVFCNVYGSILTPFGEDSYNGALVAVNSGASGKGKTSVWRAALYGLADANKLIYAGKDGATRNARWAIVGAHQNMPVVFDEMTDMDAAEVSSFAYTVSQGTDRARLTSSGGKVGFAEQHTWKAVVGITANEDMHAKLASHNANTQAEAVRMIAINFSKYNVPIFDNAIEVSDAIDKMRDNMGCAGDAFIKYVVTNQDAVAKLWAETETKLSVILPQSEYRFFRSHATATLTAARILLDLKVIGFNYDKLVEFTTMLMGDLTEAIVAGNMTSPADALNRMIRDLSNRIIVTTEYRDLRTDSRGPEDSISRIVGTPAGRRIIGNQTTKGKDKYIGKLFLAKKEFGDWCSKNRMEPKEMIKYATDNGWIIPWQEKFNMGRGTAYSTGSCTCFAFDFAAMEGTVEHTSGPVSLVQTEESAVSSAH